MTETPNSDIKLSDDGSTIIHAPKSQIVNISEVWAYVSVDTTDNTEGIMAFETSTGWMPMLAADLARLIHLESMVQEMVDKSGIPARLIKLSNRTDVKLIEPKQKKS